GGVKICRLINGMGQEDSKDGVWSDKMETLRTMERFVDEGFTTFHLGGPIKAARDRSEEWAGAFFKSVRKEGSGETVQFLTDIGFRPDIPVTKKAVIAAVDSSLRRMGKERLDLVQLNW
ncbi:unnamed protein product, partial [Choristocarpus tenellus]